MWKSGVSGEFRYFAGTSALSARPAEGDHPPAQVGDREHDPVAEAVVGDLDVLAGHEQPGLDHHLDGHALAGEMVAQGEAVGRRIADAEAPPASRAESPRRTR